MSVLLTAMTPYRVILTFFSLSLLQVVCALAPIFGVVAERTVAYGPEICTYSTQYNFRSILLLESDKRERKKTGMSEY